MVKNKKSDNQNHFLKSESVIQGNLNSEFIHCVRSIAMWGRLSGGDERSPEERLSEQVTFKNYKIFCRYNMTIPFKKMTKY
jgi:hypothetical protein